MTRLQEHVLETKLQSLIGPGCRECLGHKEDYFYFTALGNGISEMSRMKVCDHASYTREGE